MAAAGERRRWQEQSGPLWERPICTPGCAFGNDFRLCDVNTANLQRSGLIIQPSLIISLRGPLRTFRSRRLCTCGRRCPKTASGSGLVQVSRSWKGTSANWKEALIALESRTQQQWYGSHVRDTEITRVKRPLNQTWTEPMATLLMCVDYGGNVQISVIIQINQCSSLAHQS